MTLWLCSARLVRTSSNRSLQWVENSHLIIWSYPEDLDPLPRSLDGRWTNVSRLPRLSFLFLATPWELSQSSAFEAWLGNVQRICLIILMTQTLHMFIFLDLLGTISQVSVKFLDLCSQVSIYSLIWISFSCIPVIIFCLFPWDFPHQLQRDGAFHRRTQVPTVPWGTSGAEPRVVLVHILKNSTKHTET